MTPVRLYLEHCTRVKHFVGGGKEGSQRRTIFLPMKNVGSYVIAMIEYRGLFIE